MKLYSFAMPLQVVQEKISKTPQNENIFAPKYLSQGNFSIDQENLQFRYQLLGVSEESFPSRSRTSQGIIFNQENWEDVPITPHDTSAGPNSGSTKGFRKIIRNLLPRRLTNKKFKYHRAEKQESSLPKIDVLAEHHSDEQVSHEAEIASLDISSEGLSSISAPFLDANSTFDNLLTQINDDEVMSCTRTNIFQSKPSSTLHNFGLENRFSLSSSDMVDHDLVRDFAELNIMIDTISLTPKHSKAISEPEPELDSQESQLWGDKSITRSQLVDSPKTQFRSSDSNTRPHGKVQNHRNSLESYDLPKSNLASWIRIYLETMIETAKHEKVHKQVADTK